jgi:hypothetical protein
MRYGHFVMLVFCVWVLWQQAMLGRDEKWQLWEAYPTREECHDRAVKEYEYSLLPDSDFEITWLDKQTLSSRMRLKTGVQTVYSAYKCIPDTVDPRAAKRK